MRVGIGIIVVWIVLGVLVGVYTARRERSTLAGVAWGVITALFGIVALAVWLVWLLITSRRRRGVARPTY